MKAELKITIMHLAFLVALVALAYCAAGCATKSRSIEIKGMFVSESGQLAIGYGHVDAIPEATDSAVIHYKEDVALLSPSTKTHDIDIILTGSNSVSSSQGIVKKICEAFVQVAPSMAKTNAESVAKGATSPIDLAKANSDNKKAIELAETAEKEIKGLDGTSGTSETDGTAATSDPHCVDGSCSPNDCPDGNCSPSVSEVK